MTTTTDHARSDSLSVPQLLDGRWLYPQHWSDRQCEAWEAARGTRSSSVRPQPQPQPQPQPPARRRGGDSETLTANIAACPAVATVLDNPSVFPAFARDIAEKARRWTLSERQAAALTRCVEDASRPKRAAPSGRVQIEGRILKLKVGDRNSGYGYGGLGARSLKALVECDGYRLYGTVPSAIAGSVAVGDTLRIEATVTPKEDGFGFWSRPRAL
jgi:hypothetical protein